MTDLLELKHVEVKRFFLKQSSYARFDLPSYFAFESLLKDVSDKIGSKDLENICAKEKDSKGKLKTRYPSDYENVNYRILDNKDGKYAWRPLQLIHPALYVSLVNKITEINNWRLIKSRFRNFQKNKNIRCYSIPVIPKGNQTGKATLVSSWLRNVEQQSLQLSLKYEYVLHTDISDCYGTIYTHAIAWALHSKKVAKSKRRDLGLLGNSIDKHLQGMANGQTNGIPQGSILMDFLAEMVLGFADFELSSRLKSITLSEFEIIRFRDDYRIFSNSPQLSEHIAKILTEVLIELGMRLNPHKTILSNSIIRSSIKPDKLYWISTKNYSSRLQDYLLIIHKLSEEYPNSGSLSKALDKFYEKIFRIKTIKENVSVLISILADIMFKNPRVYPIASAILSKLLSILKLDEEKKIILAQILNRFEKIPNTAYLKIWLQRVTIKFDKMKSYNETLCEKVNNKNVTLWNSEWLSTSIKETIESAQIVDKKTIANIDNVIATEEVELFHAEHNSGNFS